MTEAEILALPQEERSERTNLSWGGLWCLQQDQLLFWVRSACRTRTARNRTRTDPDGGGESVLVALGSLARRYAFGNRLSSIEWIVHAVTCAKPNLKLRRVLEQRRFAIEDIAGIGRRVPTS